MVQKLVPKAGGGVVPAREILINDLNFADIISDEARSNMMHQSMESTAGCVTLEQSLFDLVTAGKVEYQTAMDNARKPKSLKDSLDRAGVKA